MEQQNNDDLFQDIPVEGRMGMLKDNCLRSEFMEVNRPYSQEELEEFKEELSQQSIQNFSLEVEMAKLVQEFKAKLKPLKAQIKENICKLRDKASIMEEEVFLFDDQDEGMMKFLDFKGELIFKRKLFPKEKQTSIHTLKHTANG